MQEICVIFDLDGTLVDSETLCNQAFVDLLPELGEAVEVLVAKYRGKKLALILADLELRLGVHLTSDFEARYRERVAELFALDLRPTVGSPEMLASIAFPYCLASSGPLTKIKHALQVSGLEPFFGTRIFSSYEVGSWKPEPGLFLHAAGAMGFAPNRCVVVEDSEVGVEAAAAAGMRVLRYAPQQGEQNLRQCASFSDMALLPGLLRSLCDTPQRAQ